MLKLHVKQQGTSQNCSILQTSSWIFNEFKESSFKNISLKTFVSTYFVEKPLCYMLHFFYIWLHDDQGMATPVDGSFAVEHIENSTGLEVSMHLHLKYPEETIK